jgi:hypothetical protein
MTNRGPFPFHTTKEAWDYFDKASRLHFVRLIKQEAEHNPEIKDKAKALQNRDYCARLLYILNMFAYEGDPSGEFDLDWAMLIAKPLSADQARRSIEELIDLGLMAEVHDIERNISLDGSDEVSGSAIEDIQRARRGFRKGSGGNTNRETKFDFD